MSAPVTIMDFKNLANAAMAAAGKPNLGLPEADLRMVDELVAKGNFKDKSDFMAFAMTVYAELRHSGSAPPTPQQVSQAVQNTPVAQGMDPQDVQGKLVPLLTSVFTSMGKNQMGF